MAKVMVTGGAGFVGRHLVERLHARGDTVRVLDVAIPAQRLPGVDYITGSILNAQEVAAALEGVERLYHIAGIAHLYAQPISRFDDINRRGTEIVLGEAVKAGTPRILHCSTESILLPPRSGGTPRPVNEKNPPSMADMPGPYTRSKLGGEQIALQHARDGADLVVVNPTVPIGHGDENMTPPAMMLDLFLSGGSPMFLDCNLNFVDVRDVADGIVLAADKGRAGERYILGGENVALRDLLRRLEVMSGRPMPKRTVPAAIALAAGTVSEWISRTVTGKTPAATREGVLIALRSAPFDSSKAKAELGYQPRPIEEALRTEIDWLLERRAGKAAGRGGVA